MNTLVETAKRAYTDGRHIVVEMESGIEVRFPVAENPRLARGTVEQLNRIEISPFGLHWPELDEDLSLRGILQGRYGQKQPAIRGGRPERVRLKHATIRGRG
jgi:hypothetical protein